MIKSLFLLFIFVLYHHPASGQNGQFQGKPIAELFTDFHVSINDTSELSGFAVERAYLGYQFIPAGKFTAKMIINAGSPEDLSIESVHHRYAYFREASLTWSDEKLTIAAGITGTKLFEFQQSFWGKRYIANTYQSINGYGFVADLGIAADYRINDILYADLTLMNGDGYNDLQVNNSLRASAGLTIKPGGGIAIRLLGDIQKQKGLWQPLAILFIGFKNDLVTIGGEVSYKSNLDLTRGHHAYGVSATGGLNLSEKTELFTRFDYSTSVIMPGELTPWNSENDCSFLITGIQYTFTPNVKLALDYQGTFPHSADSTNKNLIYLNALFRF